MARDAPEVVEVVFSVLAETSCGTDIRVVGSAEELGGWNPNHAVALGTDGQTYPKWSAGIWMLRSEACKAEYKFIKVSPNGPVEWEPCDNRRLSCRASGPAATSTPRFGEAILPPSPPKQSAPPTAASLRGSSTAVNGAYSGSQRTSESTPSVPEARSTPTPSRGSQESSQGGSALLTMEGVCTGTNPGDKLVIVGASDSLGCWDPKKALCLTTSAKAFPVWSATATVPRGVPVEWKLVIHRADGSHDWDSGNNRLTQLPVPAPGEQVGACKGWTVRAYWGGHCTDPVLTNASADATAEKPRSPATRSVTATPEAASRGRGSLVPPTTQASRPNPGASLLVPAPDVSADVAMGRRSCSANFLGPSPEGPDRVASVRARSVSREQAAGRHGEQSQQCLLVFRMRTGALASRDIDAIQVEVLFQDGASFALVHDPSTSTTTEQRWTLELSSTSRRNGMHFFCFMVNGSRRLSCDHRVLGQWNAAMFSDSVRKYLLSRGEQDGPEGPGVGRALSIGSEQKTLQQQRAWSICHNLCTMADEEPSLDMKLGFASFSPEVYDGLFDTELKLRLDGLVVPEPPACPDLHDADAAPLVLSPGACLLKKKLGACEDAYFHSPESLGVADGVGCMVQFASYGINAAAYAQELMEHAKTALAGAPAEDGYSLDERCANAISAAETQATTYGASTISVLTMNDGEVGVANLGDSGYMLLRKESHGMAIVRRSEEQQHSWNCPYQLTRLPATLLSRFPKLSLDTAKDSIRETFHVNEGDLLLLFTDGLRDNLHDRELLHIVDCAISPTIGDLIGLPSMATAPEHIARSLALAAQERSLDPAAKVPFNEYSKRHGYTCSGGKQDDITVVAAWVVRADSDPRGPCDASELPMPLKPLSPKATLSPSSAQVDSTTGVESSAPEVPSVSLPEMRSSAPAKAAAADTCPEGHRLNVLSVGIETSGYESHGCDRCGIQNIVAPASVWRCAECNYDVCMACRDSKATDASSQQPSASAGPRLHTKGKQRPRRKGFDTSASKAQASRPGAGGTKFERRDFRPLSSPKA
eukprot:TRINITY_DN111832_c0_g1_i1.p1 TRINITY_DN111832_c0_g1~~TRINITY_DN111832_c0_g1_i1.p1  ORF type:complete len:1047 (-),score=145.33 TRINITY_DN111832_c0_g1_i1:154-3294(-)